MRILSRHTCICLCVQVHEWARVWTCMWRPEDSCCYCFSSNEPQNSPGWPVNVCLPPQSNLGQDGHTCGCVLRLCLWQVWLINHRTQSQWLWNPPQNTLFQASIHCKWAGCWPWGKISVTSILSLKWYKGHWDRLWRLLKRLCALSSSVWPGLMRKIPQ